MIRECFAGKPLAPPATLLTGDHRPFQTRHIAPFELPPAIGYRISNNSWRQSCFDGNANAVFSQLLARQRPAESASSSRTKAIDRARHSIGNSRLFGWPRRPNTNPPAPPDSHRLRSLPNCSGSDPVAQLRNNLEPTRGHHRANLDPRRSRIPDIHATLTFRIPYLSVFCPGVSLCSFLRKV